MFKLNEFKRKPNKLSDYLPWALLVQASVVQQKTGVFQRTLLFRGRDLSSVTAEEQIVQTQRLNDALIGLGGGFCLHIEANRMSAPPIVPMRTENPFINLIEEIRAINLGQEALFETRYYLTFTYMPKRPHQQKLFKRIANAFGGLFTGGEDEIDERKADMEALSVFIRKTEQFVSTCQDMFHQAEFLETDALLTYLHHTISPKRHPITMPTTPMYLDDILADTPASVGVEMYMGAKYVQVVSVKGYPNWTSPGLLDALDDLPFEYRWVHRFMGLDMLEAQRVLGHYERMLFSQQNKLLNTQGDAGLKDRNALAGSDAVGHTLQRVNDDTICMGLHTCVVVVADDDKATCIKRAQQVEGIFNRAGFATSIEQGNIFPAWLSSLPGHAYTNPRQSLISSKNIAHMIPLQASWSGDEVSTHLGQAPHLYCITDGCTPYRLNLNDGDVGHTRFFGPTGSGKSTGLSGVAIGWFKYINAQVFFFDKGRSSRCATLAVGGQFLELDVASTSVAFQPLKDIHLIEERTFALDWLERLFVSEGDVLTSPQRNQLNEAINSLAASPVHLRTLSALRTQLQDKALKRTLTRYCKGPQTIYGQLWDNSEERLDLSRWVAFEMEQLMESAPKQVVLTLTYLFHRLEARFDGSPTLLILDEAWVFLQHPTFRDQIATWLRVLRKKNVYVIFATQNIADVMDSPISATLLSNCPTQILLPNPKASTPAMAPIYKKLGLNEAQIGLITHAQPKRHYYFDNPNKGSRLFELGLSELELAIVGASSPDDHKVIDHAQAQSKLSGQPFIYHYLKLTGFEHYASRFEGVSL